MISFLTIYGKTGRINLNATPREVLAALPGMDPGTADRLLEIRSAVEIRGIGDIQEILGAGYERMSPYVDFKPAGTSATFSVEATGYADSPRKGYSIAAVVTLDATGSYRYEHYKSPAEYAP